MDDGDGGDTVGARMVAMGTIGVGHYDDGVVNQYDDGVAGVDGWGGGPPGTDDARDFGTLTVGAAATPLAHQFVGGGCPEEGGPLGDGATTEVTHTITSCRGGGYYNVDPPPQSL